jgi:hypothetical protein
MTLTLIDYINKDITLKVLSNNNSDPLDPDEMDEGGKLIQSNFINIADNWNPRNVVFGINGNFVQQIDSPLTSPVQMTKNGTITSLKGIVLTNPTVDPTIFSVCKNVLAYDSQAKVASFSVATNGVVTTIINSAALTSTDHLTIYCNSTGTIPGADGNFTLTIT